MHLLYPVGVYHVESVHVLVPLVESITPRTLRVDVLFLEVYSISTALADEMPRVCSFDRIPFFTSHTLTMAVL